MKIKIRKKKMKSKRGQFYIIAAIIIIVIISSIATTVTYTVTKSAPKGIKELSNELKQEIPRIELYGTYNRENRNQLIDNFTQGDLAKYFFSKTDQSSMTMIYRNDTGNINVIHYTKKDTGSIGVQDFKIYTNQDLVKTITVEEMGDEHTLNVTILNQSYSFALNDDQDFYFVIMQNKSGEQYVEQG